MLLKEIMKCYICYQSYLNKENIIDFNDMINLAIRKLDKRNIRYKYIIIDEYQDISQTKFLFIKKLIKLSNSNFFAVGDDFQSIYKFTGSNINVITKFKKYFPFSKVIKLKKTYRNSNELVKIAGKFIMKNPFQLKKKLKSTKKIKNPVHIIYYYNLNESMQNIIDEDKINKLFILSRNNKDLENIDIKGVNYKKMSVHKSKGLQEDYIFLINVNNLSNGFPNKFANHYILNYVNNYKERYLYEEERRLFYVAITRCIKRVYIFVPYNMESCFIKEIKHYKNVFLRENNINYKTN